MQKKGKNLLARRFRLTAAELTFIRQEGNLYPGKVVDFLAFWLGDARPARVGIIVSKRTSLLATARNRVRRIFWTSWELEAGKLPKGWLVCGLAKKSSLKAGLVEFRREINSLVGKLAVLTSKQ